MKPKARSFKVRLIDRGDAVFLPLPEEVLAKLGVKVGDILYMTETPTGILLTSKRKKAPRKRNRE